MKKGFTLVELLAVIVILGVIMSIAIPNIVATIDRNKKSSYIEDAKRMISAAEYKIRSDSSIEYPTNDSITVITLSKLDNSELDESPYDTKYSKNKSFVAIAVESSVRVYNVHLVSCVDAKCENLGDNDISKVRGINKANLTNLNGSGGIDFVLKGAEVDLVDVNADAIRAKYFPTKTVKVY